jgi:hypothetical protein
VIDDATAASGGALLAFAPPTIGLLMQMLGTGQKTPAMPAAPATPDDTVEILMWIWWL